MLDSHASQVFGFANKQNVRNNPAFWVHLRVNIQTIKSAPSAGTSLLILRLIQLSVIVYVFDL